jgi:hypothetical protein
MNRWGRAVCVTGTIVSMGREEVLEVIWEVGCVSFS